MVLRNRKDPHVNLRPTYLHRWVKALDWYSYWYCTYVIMITMAFTVVNSLAGAYAVISVRQH